MLAPLKLITIGTVLTISTSAFAADVPDAGRMLRESQPPPALKQQQPPPKIVPPQQPKESVPVGVKVKVTGFAFSGNTVLSSMDLSNIMSFYVGKELTLTELSAATAAITNAYRAKGYFLATAVIPPQVIKTDAPIKIEIIEGILESVRLETKPAETRISRNVLQKFVSRLPTGKPAEEGTISDMVMRVNEIPGISSRILLEPGTQPGATKALLEVTEAKPYSVSLDTDNYGSYSTGYYRIGSTLDLYSPLHLGDQFTLRAQTSFSGDTQSVHAGYVVPVSGSGTRIGIDYSFVTYELGRSFSSLNASGEAHDFILTITQPAIRSRNLILNLSVAGEGKLLEDRTGSVNLKNQRHTATGQFGFNGVEMDSWLGSGSTSFSFNYSGGFVGIDDGSALTNDQSTTGMHTNGGYNKLAMALSRNQSIYNALSFYTGINGQWASTNLDSAEQFSLGGPSGVRAFPVSEASCDMGLVYTAELRYLIGSLGKIPGGLQLSAFVDHGYAVLHDEPVVSDNTRNLTGVGFGVSWFDSDSFNLRTSVAWRTAGAATGQSEVTQPTVYFQAVKRF